MAQVVYILLCLIIAQYAQTVLLPLLCAPIPSGQAQPQAPQPTAAPAQAISPAKQGTAPPTACQQPSFQHQPQNAPSFQQRPADTADPDADAAPHTRIKPPYFFSPIHIKAQKIDMGHGVTSISWCNEDDETL